MYLQPGRKYGKIISKAQIFRLDSDYEFFYIVSKDEANEQIEKAAEFVKEIKNYLEKKFNLSFNNKKKEKSNKSQPTDGVAKD
jgi:hypothetical protein